MMRIAVTGSMGQVATSLIEQAGRAFEIVLLGRRVFLLEDRAAVLNGLKAARPDVVINAAAYTAVDQAEAEESLAVAINGEGAGHVAEAADRIGAPLLQLSTDYVFDGALNRPYREDDPPGPRSAYGRSKLLGERLVAERCANSVIVRTAWLFSPYGANFVRTMLSLNEMRDEVSVVADQRGNPTSALDLATALLAVAARVREEASPALLWRFPHDWLGRGDLGRFRRGDLRRGGGARAPLDAGQAHHDRRLPNACAASGQFAPRQRKAETRIRP